MYAVLHVRDPHTFTLTRLVFGCIAPAERVANVLLDCGCMIDEVDTCPIAPERSAEEKLRAERLIGLAMQPAQGNA